MKNILYLVPIIFLASLFSSCRKADLQPYFKPNSLEHLSSVKTSISSVNHLLYEETFEGPNPFSTAYDPTGHIGTDYGLKLVTDPVFEGKKAARFEIRKDQPLVKNGKRAEVVVVSGKEISPEMWYSFAVYFPTVGYGYDSEREVITQWYQGGTPATSIRTKENRILVETGNKLSNLKRYDLGPIVKNTWHEVVIHFIHSYHSDGFLEIWIDGHREFKRHGGNMYDEHLPKWKIGLYKAAFKTNNSLVTRRIIFYDNIRVGKSDATYNDMVSKYKL